MMPEMIEAGWPLYALIAAAALAAFFAGRASVGTARTDLSQPPRISAPVPQQLRGRIEHALLAGNKIEAIKLYREGTGVGLKEAKDAVEAMTRPDLPQ